MATLHVSASMPSLCALSALDVTAKTQDNAKEFLLTDLRKMLAEHRNITAFDCSYCDGGTCYIIFFDSKESIN